MAYNPGFTDVTAAISIAANATSSGQCTALGGASTYTFQLTGTWTATMQVQVTRDGTNWVNITGSSVIFNLTTGATNSANITANGIYTVSVAGCVGARLITTVYTTGTVTGTAVLMQNPTSTMLQGIPLINVNSGSVTANPQAPTGYAVVTAASTNAAIIKASAGTLYELTVANVTATPIYVKFYNKSVTPTVGTDVPVVTYQVAANTTLATEFGALGKRFSTGIAIAATGASAATDTTNAVAGVQISASYV